MINQARSKILRFTLIVLTLVCCLRGFSQADTSWRKEVIFKIDPTSLSPTYYPNLQVELEFPVIGTTSLVLAGGPMVQFNFPQQINGLTELNRNGFFLNPSFKYYLQKHQFKEVHPFVSLEFDYRECSYRIKEKFLVPPSNSIVYDDTIKVENKAHGITLNFGIMYTFKRIGFEFITGAGFMLNRNSYSEEMIPNASFANKNPWHIWQKETFISPRFPTRILIYFRF
jgi:hypothetical protein